MIKWGKFIIIVIPLCIALVTAQNCPPDTLAVNPPQDYWSIPSWNYWEGIEVVTWNIEHFPQNDSSTVNGVAEIILDQSADIYALQEIDDTLAFQNQLMPLLPNYSYIIGSNGYLAHLAVIYRNEVLSVTGSTELWADTDYWDDGDQDYYNNAQYYFASRPPLQVDFEWQCGNASFNFSVIDVHLKCCNEGLDRRRIAAIILQEYLTVQVAAGDSNIVVLGDWNDDLVDLPPYDSFTLLLDDPTVEFINLSLAQDPSDYFDSYPSWPSFLDHILITAGLFDENSAGEVTTFRLDDYITDYGTLISDHRPVGWRFMPPSAPDDSPYRIVITEVMANPAAVSDTYGEWFEFYNADSVQIELSAWTIADADGDSHSVDPGIDFFAIEPGEYMVFSRNADTLVNGGYTADYEYADFILANTSDEIILFDSQGRLVDEIYYDTGFPHSSGISMYLSDYTLDNNVAINWVQSSRTYGDGDLGTPGYGANDGLSVEPLALPDQAVLFNNYPNPFNNSTRIEYRVLAAAQIKLAIYNLAGQEVAILQDEYLVPGEYTITWNVSNHASALYICSLIFPNQSYSIKLLYLK